MINKNKITFRIKNLTIDRLDEIVKENGFENRSSLINEAIKLYIEDNSNDNQVKFEFPTKKVGFRIPISKENIFKQNVHNFMEALLSENEEFLTNCLNQNKWTDDDIKYFMNFFQRNRNNLKINSEDRKFFEKVVERGKNV